MFVRALPLVVVLVAWCAVGCKDEPSSSYSELPARISFASLPVAAPVGVPVTVELANIGGAFMDDALVIAAVAPGDAAPPTHPERYITHGSLPASGPRRYLQADGSWSDTVVSYGAAADTTSLTIALPDDQPGLWQLELFLQREDREPTRHGVGWVLVHDGPGLHLTTNRLSARLDQRVRASLRLAAGDQVMRVIAYLVMPDGSERRLPGTRGPDYVDVPPGEARLVDLLDEDVAAYGVGTYQLGVRAYAAETGDAVGLAEASFTVCASGVQVTGTVTDANGAVDGARATVATVRAVSMEGEIFELQVDGAGGFGGELPPGTWSLDAAVDDAAGPRRTAAPTLVEVGCGDAPREVALVLGSPVARHVPPPTTPYATITQAATPSCATLEPIHVILWPDLGLNGVALTGMDIENITWAVHVSVHQALRPPAFSYLSDADLQQLIQNSSASQGLGNTELQGAGAFVWNTRFMIVVRLRVAGGVYAITARMVDGFTGQLLKEAARYVNYQDVWADPQILVTEAHRVGVELMANLGDPMTLYLQLAGRIEQPEHPKVTVELSDTAPHVDTTITATIRLGDQRACDPAPAGKVVSVRHTRPGGVLALQGDYPVDANGLVSVDLTVGSKNGQGEITATYNGARSASATAIYQANPPSNLKLRAAKSHLVPGEQIDLAASYTLSGTPLVGKQITAGVLWGQLTPDMLTTGSDGRAVFGYQASSGPRLVTVLAEAEPPSSSESPAQASYLFQVDASLDLSLTVEPRSSVLVGSMVELVAVVDAANGLRQGIPVRFATTGGMLSSTGAVTNATGIARVQLAVPTSGSGSAEVTASASLGGQSRTVMATVQWREACSGCPFTVSVNGIPLVDWTFPGASVFSINSGKLTSAPDLGPFPVIGKNGTLQFSSNHIVAWSVTGGGTINNNGTLTAGNVGGQWEVHATSLDAPGTVRVFKYWVALDKEEVYGSYSGPQEWVVNPPDMSYWDTNQTPAVFVMRPCDPTGRMGNITLEPMQPPNTNDPPPTWPQTYTHYVWRTEATYTCQYISPQVWYPTFNSPVYVNGGRVLMQWRDNVNPLWLHHFVGVITGPGVTGLSGYYVGTANDGTIIDGAGVFTMQRQ